MLIKSVNKIELTILVDNYSDILLESPAWMERAKRIKNNAGRLNCLTAEHGLSIMIKAAGDDLESNVLMDFGTSGAALMHNLDFLDISLEKVDTLVLSHGHFDHFGGLMDVKKKIDRQIPFVMHPDAVKGVRYGKKPDGTLVKKPMLDQQKLEQSNFQVLQSETPYISENSLWATTGTIERTTSYEKGMPDAWVEMDGKLEFDAINDDMSIVFHLKDKGLVIISGCAHAGIVNTVLHSRRLTGIDQVHAVIGGFHLGGSAFEPIIEDSVMDLLKYDPEIIVPMHCSGPAAINRMREVFGEKFAYSAVGTKIIL
jgi:7,8-dihydropterin-6-yl-methyl-4-(beta-D-ribofuranosyl)aminobenzene 5'-phosphate synthase